MANSWRFELIYSHIILRIAFVFILILVPGATWGANASIIQIENNLLPPMLIEGEQPYNLLDRMEYYKVPGVSIAVIKDFKIDLVKQYGLRDVELDLPVTDSTLFGAGSLSKAAAAVIILHMVYEGKFNLDDNVNDYLTSWKVPENEFTRQAAVTIGRLLNHSSGFEPSPPMSFAPEEMPDLIQYLNAEPPLNIQPATIGYVPGTAFKYSNAGFSTLQILAEDISGQSFPKFAQEVLFDRLRMKHSTFEQPLSPDKDRYAASGHNSEGQTMDIRRYAYPCVTAGGLWCSAEDYAKLIIEIQKALKGKSTAIFSQKLAQQMVMPHEAKEYGFGVFMRYTDSVTYFGHIGDQRGFFAGFVAHPTEGYGAVVMTNGANGINLIREIIASVASVYDWQTYLPPVHALAELDPETKSKYTGRYRIAFDNFCEITESNGNLYYSTPSLIDLRLYPVSQDTAISKDKLGHIVFHADTNGEVTACTPYFSDDIGRLPATETMALKMTEGERTPLEMALAGEIEAAVLAYKEYRAKHPDDPMVSENRFNQLGYQLLYQKKLLEALSIFRLNTELFPGSGNCWDSYAEAHYVKGDRAEALRLYKKALELNPSNGNAKRWIEKLESGN